MAGTELRTVRFEAVENVEGWYVRFVFTRTDEEGTNAEPIVATMVEPIAYASDTLEQGWLVLLAAMQICDDLRGHGYDTDSYYERLDDEPAPAELDGSVD